MNGSVGGGRAREAGEGGDHSDSYLICATPRTGSTLLCGLLESTGVAGHPESYFRREDERSWATRWDLIGSEDGSFGFDDYLAAAISAGRTGNGVFAARVMWGTLDDVVARLGSIHPDIAGSDIGLLRRALGTTRFIHLQRNDVVGQAVSWMRAEQTGLWQEIDRAHLEGSGTEPPKPHLDLGRIHDLVQTIDAHNVAWREWFASAAVRPHRLRYEDIVVDPVGVTRGLLDFLALEVSPELEIRAHHERLADHLNAQWADRYRARYGR